MGTVSDRTWNEILSRFRSEHPELHRPWFARLAPEQMDNGVIHVPTADIRQYEFLTRQCQAGFSRAAQLVMNRLVTVDFLEPSVITRDAQPLSFESETEGIVLNPDYTFENFVTGPCNRLAQAACIATAESPGHAYNPLFIHGDVGLGKTHLLQAICHQIRSNRPDARILYISCETFTNHFIEAIERGAVHRFRDRYRHVDVLVIDDIQFLSAGERSREEFFHTFNALYQSQRQIVLSADESPREIPSLEDRLVSRFSWGLVARIDAPCLETRSAIVRKKAKVRCVDLPEDVVHYIATVAQNNIREIEGCLTRILALSQQFGGHIDLSVARQALGDEDFAPKRSVAISNIFEVVMDRYNIRLADLQGKRRSRSITFPRQVCMYLARELTSLSLEEIGGYFGGRDHTTVLHGIRTVETQRSQDPELSLVLKQMTDRLRK